MQTLTSVNTPTIGAVIINYNYATFLPDAIESVLKQRSAFDDVIVVDDGSSDNSLQTIERFRDRVKVLSKSNGGQLSACIAGTAELTTDYVYFLDSDDYAAPEMVSTLRRKLHGDPVKIQFQLRSVDGEKNPIGPVFPTYAIPYAEKEMRDDNEVAGFYVCPPTSGNLFRRETFASLNFELIDTRDFVDGVPAVAMPYLGKVVSLNMPLAYYRVHGTGHSRWDQPNRALLEREMEWFGDRWRDTCKLLDFNEPPFAKAEPLYLLERKLMLAALQSAGTVLRPAISYVRRLAAANFTSKQKWMLGAWAISLLLPSASWRKKQVFARRSPVNRSRVLRRLIGLVMNCRGFSSSKTAGREA